MISAQADQIIQDQLIERYMMLPNQVWDDIINSAAKVREESIITVKFCSLSLMSKCSNVISFRDFRKRHCGPYHVILTFPKSKVDCTAASNLIRTSLCSFGHH